MEITFLMKLVAMYARMKQTQALAEHEALLYMSGCETLRKYFDLQSQLMDEQLKLTREEAA